MKVRPQNSWKPKALRVSTVQKVFALATVAVFCLQLSRFYLLIELDRFICLEANHTHEVGSVRHDHPHAEDGLLPHDHDDGFFFQHCKDSFGEIALTPVQPLGVPVTVSHPQPEPAWTDFLKESRSPLENFLPPPFQPPRSSS